MSQAFVFTGSLQEKRTKNRIKIRVRNGNRFTAGIKYTFTTKSNQ
ncbi:MAG: hypothetical protein SH817_00135 [Leptospira sp.]|nr:hypothetical protein [Leptospira sp.]